MTIKRRFKERIEKLMGAELQAGDLSFLNLALPVVELDRLKEFSAVNSATLNKAGVSQLQGRVSEILDAIGFKIQTVRGEEKFSHLVVAERPGKSKQFITLVTHTDTVLPNDRE